MAQRLVCVICANVGGDQPDKTMVLVDPVPMQVKFDNATAFSAFESSWSKTKLFFKNLQPLGTMRFSVHIQVCGLDSADLLLNLLLSLESHQHMVDCYLIC